MGISEGVSGNTGNLIKNFSPGDTIDFLGAVGLHHPVVNAQGLLTFQTTDTNHPTISILLENKPYLQILDFNHIAPDDKRTGTLVTATVKAGYEIVGAEAGHTLADIAARYNVSVNTLQKINSVFTDASFDVGGLVHGIAANDNNCSIKKAA